jgi:UDP-N-acetylmuramyl pentapeptide phosphotransferase/UDP-N-acetylglucosamine-1-phosphate transferase
MLVALIVVILVHPGIVNFAKRRKIVDNPNARKLQRMPIPVLGGVAVFFGLMVGLCVASLFFDIVSLLPVHVGISVMLCIGVVDDVSELSPKLRFLVEIVVALMLMFWTNVSLNDFQGLWGVNEVPLWVSAPLTVVAVVGIINAINLVDGVDGLSSGYCIMASVAFGVLFFHSGNYLTLLLCALSIGGLLPFFFHNVFGKSTKMFIGDGGSLMMGVIMSTYVVATITSGGSCEKFVDSGFGAVPFALAVMCVPVFDTVRVMIMRIIRGTSPFNPDKTHLHHLFIEMGFSHFGTTASELLLNIVVIVAWFISYKMGASVNVQFYVVMGVGLLLTAGFYKLVKLSSKRNGLLCKTIKWLGGKTHFEENKGWSVLQKIVDYR